MPEYFYDYRTMLSCNSVVRELPQTKARHKDLLVFIFWGLTLDNEFTAWPANFNIVYSSVRVHGQEKTRTALLLAVQSYSPTQMHYTYQLKWDRWLEKWPNKSTHSSTPTKEHSCAMKLKGVSMTNHSLFKQW